MRHQDLTIFSVDDDAVPLDGYGTVDEEGNILVPTFSTDENHPRPYLKYQPNIGESEVNFIEGSSSIAQMVAEIVDFPTEPGDQDSGLFTLLLAGANGDTQLLGVRVVYRQQDEEGTYRVLFDGVGGLLIMPKLTTFRWALRDARERERKMHAFNRATETAIFPTVGPVNGWGHHTRYHAVNGWETVGHPVMPGVVGEKCVTRLYTDPNTLLVNIVEFDFSPYMTSSLSSRAFNSPLGTLWRQYGNASPADENSSLYLFKDAIVEWSADNATNWKRIVNPPVGANSGYNLFNFVRGVEARHQAAPGVARINLTILDNALRPANGQIVYVRVLSNKPPTKEVPLFLEERAGDTLQKLYDTDYSLPDTTLPVRYDEDQMEDFVASSPVILALITESIDNVREWVQENLYRVCRGAPAVRDGKVFPIKYELPDATEELVQLDASNTKTAEWQHGPDNVVNQVVVNYSRYYVPNRLSPTFEEIEEQPVKIDYLNTEGNSLRRHGAKPITFSPVTISSVVAGNRIGQMLGTVLETGRWFALKVQDELTRRFTNGAQIVEAECIVDEAVDSLYEGRWVIGAWPWLPDYVTKRRGMNRLLQVVKVKKDRGPHVRGFLLLDAGPHDVPVGQPTLNAAITQNADLSVTIEVTAVPAGVKAEVQYALGAVEPGANSGQWISLPLLDGPGEVVTGPLVPGQKFWKRVRGVKNGRRSSAWTVPTSTDLNAFAELTSWELQLIEAAGGTNGKKPEVTWEKRSSTGGLRIHYEVFDMSDDVPVMPLANSVDVNANDLVAILPVTLTVDQRVTVVLGAYPGFAAGAVTGVLGAVTAAKTEPPDVNFIPVPTHAINEVDTNTREVTLTVIPSSLTILYRLDFGTWVERVGGTTTFNVEVGSTDRILEFYARGLNGRVSETRRLTVDLDPAPEFTSYSVTEETANVPRLVFGVDDDVVDVGWWARRNAYPTNDGTAGGTPLEQFRIHPGGLQKLSVDFYASGDGGGTSTWRIVGRAYDKAGLYTQVSLSILINGAPALVGALSNVHAQFNIEGGLRYIDLLWDHNATVQAGGHTVTIREAEGLGAFVEVVTGRAATQEHDDGGAVANVGGYHRQKPAEDLDGEYRTFHYEIDLIRSSDSALLATYTASISGWFATGGGEGGDPPDDIPADLLLVQWSAGTVRGSWTNTDPDSQIALTWEMSESGAGDWTPIDVSYLEPGEIEQFFNEASGLYLRFKARYFNGYGDGDSSDYSNVVQIP